MGFFGYVYRGAIIKNLTLSDVALFVKSGTETAVGILCGRAESAHILNCDVKNLQSRKMGEVLWENLLLEADRNCRFVYKYNRLENLFCICKDF